MIAYWDVAIRQQRAYGGLRYQANSLENTIGYVENFYIDVGRCLYPYDLKEVNPKACDLLVSPIKGLPKPVIRLRGEFMNINYSRYCHLILAAGLALAPPAHATIIKFSDLGTFTSSSVSVGGLTVTGSKDVYVWNLNGLGVVGGILDNIVDEGEYLDFVADGPNEISYFDIFGTLVNVDGGAIDSFTVEGFDSLGTSLGASSLKGLDPNSDLISQLGFTSVDRLRITSSPDRYRISAVDVSFVSSAVPEPTILTLLGLGLAGLAATRRRKR